MPGICLDALNPVGHPTTQRLKRVHTTAIRAELRAGYEYSTYINSLGSKLQNYLLIGPSTERPILIPIPTIPRPHVIIIGNEPDGVGESSWSMSTDEYVQLWNNYAPVFKTWYQNTRLCAAGMVGDPHFLSICWPDLTIKPDYVNKHYPNNESELKEYREIFNRPVIVGEWCWKTATQQEMTEWIAMLNANTLEHFWFCWSDGMVDSMGLVSKIDHTTVAYRRYKKAIETLS